MNHTALRFHHGHAALLLTAALFGLAFIFQRHGAQVLSALHFMSWRLVLSTAFLVLCWLLLRLNRRNRQPLGHWLIDGCVCGILMFLGMISQQWGLSHTTAGKSGFITSLYVIFVPLIALFMGQRISKKLLYALTLTLVGLCCFVSIQSDDSTLSWNQGDTVTLLSAFLWAFFVLYIGYAVRRSDVLTLSTFQLFIATILSLLCMLGSNEGIAPLFDAEKLRYSFWDIIFTGIGSSAIAFFMQSWGQRLVPATPAAIILSLESVFALFFGWLLLNEQISPLMFIGCILLLIAMIMAQFDDSPAKSNQS
ncbi:MAG: DMT family transporter [Cardiobacteriaceae bacterium]|nr:DMT family transporter [Cardiobacteriaceae bacterium]